LSVNDDHPTTSIFQSIPILQIPRWQGAVLYRPKRGAHGRGNIHHRGSISIGSAQAAIPVIRGGSLLVRFLELRLWLLAQTLAQ
jgi:hypothetical protein